MDTHIEHKNINYICDYKDLLVENMEDVREMWMKTIQRREDEREIRGEQEDKIFCVVQ
jgi:hypothetical protein